jgi:hypothetical protein
MTRVLALAFVALFALCGVAQAQVCQVPVIFANGSGGTVSPDANDLNANFAALQNCLIPATTTSLGLVQPDGSTITVSGQGVISAVAGLLVPGDIRSIPGLGTFFSNAGLAGVFSGTSAQNWEQELGVFVTDRGTNIQGIAKMNAIVGTEVFGGGGTGPGNRGAIWGTLNQVGPTSGRGPGNCCLFNTAIQAYNKVDVGNTAGNELDYAGMVSIMSVDGGAASNALGVGSAEFDVNISTGSVVPTRTGILIDSGGIGGGVGGIRGSVFDAAISIAADYSGSASWKNGIVFGNPNGVWPFATDSILMGAFGSGSMPASVGIYLGNVTFSEAAIQTPGFTVTPTGDVQVMDADVNILGFFAGTTSALRLKASGASAFIASTNTTGSSFQGLGLQGTGVEIDASGGGAIVLSGGPLDLSGVVNGGTATNYVCVDSAKHVVIQAGAC